ncbi:hypothetical protein NRB15_22840 [Pseudomonas alliivorans]|uniref:hypothetical protein n=1 Tax=Pseudomonas alliivorans TaxID=2810613 RepID=UPI00211BDE04|nr:hypothetical protein [Pseudomonas alliivorans]MCQ9473185.1 hypothetical protein [Pseudomonas alliivorans]
MKIDTSTATSRLSQTPQSAALEKTPPPRSGSFAQVLKGVESSNARTSIPPASATLNRLAQPRSSVFMQNMSLAQRRSAVEEKGFSARPAALERVPIYAAAQPGGPIETESNRSQPQRLALSANAHPPYVSGREFESNGAAQKYRVKHASENPAELKVLVNDFMHNTMNLELLDLSDYPIIRYHATGEPVTKESAVYFSSMLHAVKEQRKQLYETEVSKGTSDLDIVKKLMSFHDNLPDRFKKMTNW